MLTTAPPLAAVDPKPSFPLKVSANRRHLVDSADKPFFIHGDSPWELFWQLTREEAVELLDNRAAKGFNTIFLDVPPYTEWSEPLAQTNRYGALPFSTPGDFSTPNSDYFDHVEWCVREMNKRGMLAMLVCADLGHTGVKLPKWDHVGGMWHPLYLKNGVQKCGDYGRWLGRRFKDHNNILWVLGGDRDPGDVREHVEAMARGLEEVVPDQLKTYHAGAKSSSVFFHHAPWLDINMSYGYRDTYLFVWPDYQLTPTKPCFLAESGYEGESLDGRGGSPQRMRRQVYWAVLSGASGHLYGSAAWTVQRELWRKWLDSPGAQHMAVLGRFFNSIEWWKLVPDVQHRVLTPEFDDRGDSNHITIAGTPDKGLVIAYFPASGSVIAKRDVFPGSVKARWFDPTTGEYRTSNGNEPSNLSVRKFITPGKNAAGESDWVLLLESSASGRESK